MSTTGVAASSARSSASRSSASAGSGWPGEPAPSPAPPPDPPPSPPPGRSGRCSPEALVIARELELDLVEVAPNANPPVCRIMNYHRYVYEQEQRRRQSRRKATNVVIKEMKFRPKIDEHDYTTKMKHVLRFLGEGNKVKLTIMFRGREMAHPELGLKILNRVADDVGDVAV